MLRKINHILNLYLCQSANWQCVLESQDEESAATTAAEKVMLSSKDDFFCLSSSIAVKKLSNNLLDSNEEYNTISFYSQMILANAGFHVESTNLHLNLIQQSENPKDE
jgi:hypothetical protein